MEPSVRCNDLACRRKGSLFHEAGGERPLSHQLYHTSCGWNTSKAEEATQYCPRQDTTSPLALGSKYSATPLQPYSNLMHILAFDCVGQDNRLEYLAMSSMQSATFGPGNRGFQVGQNYGPITTEFYLPPSKIIAA